MLARNGGILTTKRIGLLPGAAVAFHEAGHGVTCLIEGLAVHAMTIVPNGDTLGSCTHELPVDSPRNRNRLARVGLGGIVAETLAMPTTTRETWDGAYNDIEDV